jgi:hypothetical protein
MLVKSVYVHVEIFYRDNISMDRIIQEFDRIEQRLSLIESEIRKLKRKPIKNITMKRTRSMPLQKNKPQSVSDTTRATDASILPTVTKPVSRRPSKTLNEAIHELGFSESIGEDRRILEGREEKSSSS